MNSCRLSVAGTADWGRVRADGVGVNALMRTLLKSCAAVDGDRHVAASQFRVIRHTRVSAWRKLQYCWKLRVGKGKLAEARSSITRPTCELFQLHSRRVSRHRHG